MLGRLLVQHLRPYRMLLLGVVVFQAAQSIASLALPSLNADVIDQGVARGDIGEPLSAQTVMQYIGPDIFHPNPDFYYAPGGGPLFDMGPYYLTTLVQVFGSVKNVAAFGTNPTELRFWDAVHGAERW